MYHGDHSVQIIWVKKAEISSPWFTVAYVCPRREMVRVSHSFHKRKERNAFPSPFLSTHVEWLIG